LCGRFGLAKICYARPPKCTWSVFCWMRQSWDENKQ